MKKILSRGFKIKISASMVTCVLSWHGRKQNFMSVRKNLSKQQVAVTVRKELAASNN